MSKDLLITAIYFKLCQRTCLTQQFISNYVKGLAYHSNLFQIMSKDLLNTAIYFKLCQRTCLSQQLISNYVKGLAYHSNLFQITIFTVRNMYLKFKSFENPSQPPRFSAVSEIQQKMCPIGAISITLHTFHNVCLLVYFLQGCYISCWWLRCWQTFCHSACFQEALCIIH